MITKKGEGSATTLHPITKRKPTSKWLNNAQYISKFHASANPKMQGCTMSQAPSMPMYWDAYLADTTHLTTEEHGAYMLLLAAMWRRNGWVPDDDKDNARILGMTTARWRRTKSRLSDFLIFENDSISQKKLQEIWENTQEKIQTNKKNGALGGRPKSNKNKDLEKANGSDLVNPIKTIPEPEPEPYIKDTIVSLTEKEKMPVKKQKRKCQLPDQWTLSPKNIDDAERLGLGFEEMNTEESQFHDFHRGKGSAMLDWDAAWRTWCRNSIKFANRGYTQRNKETDLEAMSRIAKEGLGNVGR